jgi:hypothetical protein
MDTFTPRKRWVLFGTIVECWITAVTYGDIEQISSTNGSAPETNEEKLARYLLPHFWAGELCEVPLFGEGAIKSLSPRQLEEMQRELFEFSGVKPKGGAATPDAAFRDSEGTTAGAVLVSSGESVRVPAE